jgi:hypothetical protein
MVYQKLTMNYFHGELQVGILHSWKICYLTSLTSNNNKLLDHMHTTEDKLTVTNTHVAYLKQNLNSNDRFHGELQVGILHSWKICYLTKYIFHT